MIVDQLVAAGELAAPTVSHEYHLASGAFVVVLVDHDAGDEHALLGDPALCAALEDAANLGYTAPASGQTVKLDLSAPHQVRRFIEREFGGLALIRNDIRP